MEVLQTVVLDWLKRRKRKKQKALQAYQIARKEYDEQMAALETILAARQAYVNGVWYISRVCLDTYTARSVRWICPQNGSIGTGRHAYQAHHAVLHSFPVNGRGTACHCCKCHLRRGFTNFCAAIDYVLVFLQGPEVLFEAQSLTKRTKKSKP